MIHEDWLRPLLRCPTCKGELHDSADNQLLCPVCQVTYPIDDGVPGLLPHQAEPRKGLT